MVSLLDKADWVLEAAPADGSPITNRRVRDYVAERHQELSASEYFEARDHLLGLGVIGRKRGPGGMVYRTRPVQGSPPLVASRDWTTEENLYAPIADYLRLSFARHPDVDVRALDVSPHWRAQSGRWSVPDLILLARQSYEFFDGYDLDVTTFEVKTQGGLGERPVYQAYAQSAFAHAGYLLWHCADPMTRKAEVPRLKVDCESTGIGLIVCGDPLNHDSYEILRVAERKSTPTAVVDQFLSDRLSAEQADAVLAWLKGSGES